MGKPNTIQWLKLTRKMCPNISLVILMSVWNHLLTLDKYHNRDFKELEGGHE